MNQTLAFITDRGDELLQRLGEHVVLAFSATFVATLLGIILALAAFYSPRSKNTIMGVINMMQAVPSLAMLALLLALFQTIGIIPTIVALVLYGLLPITRGTLTGLENTSAPLVEAARGIGLTPWQQLRLVRLPLALPDIVSGIRVAAVIGIGIATVAALIGAGALGQIINRGLSLSDTSIILLGAIPAIVLALLVDFMLAFVQRSFFWGEGGSAPTSTSKVSRLQKVIALFLPLLLVISGFYFAFAPRLFTDTRPTITIGTKLFTESRLLGEIIAQQIEAETDLLVERRFGLAGTLIAHGALVSGDIDLYPEYTGTSIANIIKQDVGRDPDTVFRAVKSYYAKHYNLYAMPPLGFNNSYEFATSKQVAELHNLKTLSDLIDAAPKLSIGVDFEFAERDDGLKALRAEYGLEFRRIRDVHPNLIFDVLARSEVDVIDGYTTDGRIQKHGFIILEDDLDFFPPYDAFIVIRVDTIKRYPMLHDALMKLSGAFTDDSMRALNYRIDALGEDPEIVAREFIETLR